MPSIVGAVAGLAIGRSAGLEGSDLARAAILPATMGFNILSLVLTKVVVDKMVADQEAKPPPVPQKPTIAVSPGEHNYGEVIVGSSASMIAVVSNTGTAELVVTAGMRNTDVDFAIASGGDTFFVAPGATHPMEVRFTPTTEGDKEGLLIMSTNDTGHLLISIKLTGIGKDSNTG